MKMSRRLNSLSSDVGEKLPTEIRFFRAGLNTTAKGDFFFTAKSAELILQQQEKWGNDFSFDYEHRATTGDVAPAAGWYKLEVRDGELWAVNIRWTEDAKRYILKKLYRYISPTFYADEEGQIVEFFNCALTNVPATDNCAQLIAATKLLVNQEDTVMDLTIPDELGQQLSDRMTAVAYEGDVNAYVSDILTSWLAEQAEEMMPEEAPAEEVAAEAKPEDEKVVEAGCDKKKLSLVSEVARLSAKVVALEASIAKRDQDELVASIIKCGKATKAQEKLLRSLSAAQLNEWARSTQSTKNSVAIPAKNESAATFEGKTLKQWAESSVSERYELSLKNPALYAQVKSLRGSK